MAVFNIETSAVIHEGRLFHAARLFDFAGRDHDMTIVMTQEVVDDSEMVNGLFTKTVICGFTYGSDAADIEAVAVDYAAKNNPRENWSASLAARVDEMCNKQACSYWPAEVNGTHGVCMFSRDMSTITEFAD